MQYNNHVTAESGSNFNKVYDECKPKQILIFIGFKFMPIILYLLLKLTTSQLMGTFILTILMVAADFWITKNMGGVQLAALKWYTKQTQNNQQKWCFQSSQIRVASTLNVAVFWLGQFIAVVFWIIILFINLITLSALWVFLALFCCFIIGLNIAFFLQCKGDHQKKLNALTKRLGLNFYELNEQK